MPNRNSIQRYVLFLAFAFFALILSLIPTEPCNAEEITLTTYYPSPYGVYSEMRLYPKADATTPCDPLNPATQIGVMYYDNTFGDEGLKVCGGSPPAWQPVGGGGYWAANTSNPNDIHNTNSGRVGIGTSTIMGFLSLARETYATDAYISFDTRVGPDGTTKRWGEVFASQQTDITDNINGGGMTDNSARNGWGISFGDNLDAFQVRRVKATGGVGASGVLFSIINNGNVGIGTTGPSVPLHIASSTGGAIRIADGTQAAGRVLTSDANGVGTWQPSGGGGMSNVVVINSSRTFTVPAGITKLWVEVYGGGGGGGGSSTTYNSNVPGAGGGAGGVAMDYVAVTPGQNIAVTVGAGGSSPCGGVGNRGGFSKFLGLQSGGGSGGFTTSGYLAVQGGSGGSASGGSINLSGGIGTWGFAFPAGGSSYVGIMGYGGSNTRGIGGGNDGMGSTGGSIFGGGGAGAWAVAGSSNSCFSGGSGGSGGVIIWY